MGGGASDRLGSYASLIGFNPYQLKALAKSMSSLATDLAVYTEDLYHLLIQVIPVSRASRLPKTASENPSYR